MTKRFCSFRQFALWLAATSSITTLAACDMMSNMNNPFGDGRQTQVLDGPRRVPVLNQQQMPPEQQSGIPAPAPVAPQAALPKPSPETDPYDYYNNTGAPAVPAPAPAPAQTQNAAPADGQTQSNFFTRLFSGNNDGEVRKPLAGNDPSAPETSATAPLPPSPGSAPVPPPTITPLLAPPEPQGPGASLQRGTPATLSSLSPSADTASAPADIKPTAENGESEGFISSWFSRLTSGDEKPADNKPEDPAAAAAMKAELKNPYPDLSSVPPPPAEFKAVKDSREQNMQEMKDEHAAALQEKQALDSEPSTQAPLAPPVDVTPSDTGATPEKTTTGTNTNAYTRAEAPTPAPEAPSATKEQFVDRWKNRTAETLTSPPPAPIELPKPGEPQLLGHLESPPEAPPAAGVEAPTPATKEVVLTTAPADAPKPAEPAPAVAQARAEPAPEAAEEPAHPTYWWQGWDLFSKHKGSDADDKTDTSDAMSDSPAPAAPATDMTPLPAAAPPVAAEMPAAPAVPQEATIQPPVTPLLPLPEPQAAAPSAVLPALPSADVPAAAAVADTAPAPVPDGSAQPAALPSPQILQEVRTLPPSRYAARQKALQPPSDY